MSNSFSMQPDEVQGIARDIERIVDDLRTAQKGYADYAHPAATGKDEVSVAVAHTTSKMGTSQEQLGNNAIRDLTELAQALSDHATGVQRIEENNAITLGAISLGRAR